MTVAYVCLILGLCIDLFVPELIRRVIDCGTSVGVAPQAGCFPLENPADVVRNATLLILGLTVLRGTFQFGQSYLAEFGAQGIAYDIRTDFYHHLQRLSFSWHDRVQSGALMARATSDVEQLRNFTGRAVMMLAQVIFLTVGITVVLFITNWKLAVLALLIVPVLLRTVVGYNQVIRPMFQQIQEELSLLASIVQENLAGSKVVKAFAREDEQIAKFDRRNNTLLREYLSAARIQSLTNPLMDSMANIAMVVVLWFGGLLIMQDELSVGQLVAFNTYLLLIIRPVRRLGFLISQASRALAASERIFDVLDAPVTIDDKPEALLMPPIRGRVDFAHVTLGYFGDERALDDVSFTAEPGQIVALLGTTGSGKTSIVNLIPRFYDVLSGHVLIDGHDVRDVQLNSLRKQIGIVLQDTTLFTGTIRENVAFGIPDAADDQIIAMAKAAHAHDFIMRFPEGYDTPVGERGVTLSGGQKQRVAIARALLINPSILILDDFTSAVDTETEALIREALDALMVGRTTFVIAQRVSTVRSADTILVMDHGKIAAMGTHAALLEASSIYAETYHMQLIDSDVQEMLGAPTLEEEQEALAALASNKATEERRPPLAQTLAPPGSAEGGAS